MVYYFEIALDADIDYNVIQGFEEADFSDQISDIIDDDAFPMARQQINKTINKTFDLPEEDSLITDYNKHNINEYSLYMGIYDYEAQTYDVDEIKNKLNEALLNKTFGYESRFEFTAGDYTNPDEYVSKISVTWTVNDIKYIGSEKEQI